jgi:N-acetylglucosamine-6-phosphate deacetylase
MTVGGQDPKAPALVRRLSDRGIAVSLGHTNPSPAQLDEVLAAGAGMVTHLFNACGPLHQRRPGLASQALTIDGLAVSFIADGVHVDPSWLRVIAAAKRWQDQILITDSVAIGGSVHLDPQERVARSDNGTIAGSVLTMDAAVRRMVNEVGVALEHACRAASTNPAAILRLGDRGEITPGRRADLTMLDAGLHVAGVLVAGREPTATVSR